MSTDTPDNHGRHDRNKRVIAQNGLDVGYPHKAVKVAGSPAMDVHACTPFQQNLKEALATPPTAQTLTPCTPNFSGKRDIVHRLRQQLKNRDEMIMQMQTQILEQSRVVHMSQLRIGDLELLLTSANRSLFVAEQEIEYLRKLLAECCSCRPASCQVRKNMSIFDSQHRSKAEYDGTYREQYQDMKDLVSEAKRLTEKLKVVGDSKRGRAREYEKQIQRLNHLRSELAEARSLASRNASLFEASEKERTKLSGALTGLQQKLESQAIKLEHRRASGFTSGPVSYPITLYREGQESENTIDASAPACSFTSHNSGTTGSAEYTTGDTKSQSPPNQIQWEDDISQLSFEMKKQVAVEGKELDSPTRHSVDETGEGRLGSPEIYVRSRTRRKSNENTHGSFKRFVFDMNRDSGSGVVMLNHTDESYFGTRAIPESSSGSSAAAVSLSPFSKMMAKLDLLQPSPAASLADSVIVSETIERSIGSIDTAFDRRIFDNTLDDVVRVCSPPSH